VCGAYPQISLAHLLVYGSAAPLSPSHQTIVPPLEIYISGELSSFLGAWWYWLVYNRHYTISSNVHFLQPSSQRIAACSGGHTKISLISVQCLHISTLLSSCEG